MVQENPTLTAKELFSEFDEILAEAGVYSTESFLTFQYNSEDAHPLSTIVTQFYKKQSLSKLAKNYANIENIVAEIAALISEEAEYFNIDFPPIPTLNHDNEDNLIALISYIIQCKNILTPLIEDSIGTSKTHHLNQLIESKRRERGKGFYYEFTDGDLTRVQTLINELREQISESDLFELGHRQRLLSRLEKLQSEIHKKMSDIDRVWGLVGDAGVVLGKFGNDAKPFVDRIKELVEIVWRTQSRSEELPSGTHNPMLGSDYSDTKQ